MKKVCTNCQAEFDDPTLEECPNDGGTLLTIEDEGDDPLIGMTVDGRYVVESLLGAGGMGAVYRAHQKTMNRDIALKVLKHELSSDPQIVKRFLREVQVVSVLRHPNTIMVYDFGQTPENLLYIAMEYLEGAELSGKLKKAGALPVKEGLDIVSQVCGSLSEAHGKGVVHRDLKPDNIFLADLGGTQVVKVLDFGIAKLDSGKEQTQLTRAGLTVGTPPYMSPEQAEGRAEITPGSDIYSLGCILYECLTGRPPFVGESPVKILMDHCTSPPPPMQAVQPGIQVPQPVEALVMAMLEKDPARRPSSAKDLQTHLENLKSGTAAPLPQPPGADLAYGSTAAWDSSEVSAAVATGQQGAFDPTGATSAWDSQDGSVGAVPPGSLPRPATDLAGEAVPASTAAAVASVKRGGFPVIPVLVALLLVAGGAGTFFFLNSKKGKGGGKSTATAVSVSGQEKARSKELEKPKEIKFWLTSVPTGAKVLDGKKEIGSTPIELAAPKKPWDLTLSVKGYESMPVSIVPGQKAPLKIDLKKAEKRVGARPRARPRPRPRPKAKPKARPKASEEEILVDDLK